MDNSNWNPFTAGAQVVERIRTNSALNPLLWLAGIVFLFCMPTSYFTSDTGLRMACIAMCAVAAMAAIVAYFIWMFREPEKLQSEDHQYRMTQLRLLGDDRSPGDPNLLSAPPTANTALEGSLALEKARDRG